MTRIAGLLIVLLLLVTTAYAESVPDDRGEMESWALKSPAGDRTLPFRVPSEYSVQRTGAVALAQDPGEPADPTARSREESVKTPINPQGAVMRSIALPGWGQRHLGNHVRGAFFTGAELLLWTGIAVSYLDHVDGKAAYEEFAARHAGVTGNPGHDFYVNIGNYDSREDYNEVRRQRRDYANQYTGSATFWHWDSEENRQRFEDTRIQADASRNRIYYFVGGLLLNRLGAAIDAGRTVSQRNKAHVQMGYDARTGGPGLVWSGWVW
jgi:hypothetical protein